jgi:hypothetical protein
MYMLDRRDNPMKDDTDDRYHIHTDMHVNWADIFNSEKHVLKVGHTENAQPQVHVHDQIKLIHLPI